jgi:hypothetical protein
MIIQKYQLKLYQKLIHLTFLRISRKFDIKRRFRKAE